MRRLKLAYLFFVCYLGTYEVSPPLQEIFGCCPKTLFLDEHKAITLVTLMLPLGTVFIKGTFDVLKISNKTVVLLPEVMITLGTLPIPTITLPPKDH